MVDRSQARTRQASISSFAGEGAGAVHHFERAARGEAAAGDREHEGVEERQIVPVERAVDEDRLARQAGLSRPAASPAPARASLCPPRAEAPAR